MRRRGLGPPDGVDRGPAWPPVPITRHGRPIALLTAPSGVPDKTAREAVQALRAFGEGRRLDLSAYDAHYLELAERYGIPLATLDQDLLEAAATQGIRGLSG
jgi:predicted nucleic acid-binding protein